MARKPVPWEHRLAQLPPLVRDYVVRSLQAERQLAPLTLRQYLYHLRGFCTWLARQAGKEPLTLGPDDFRKVDWTAAVAWVATFSQEGLGVAARNNRLAAVSGLFSFLERSGVVARNPFLDLRRPRHKPKVVRYLRDGEAERLLACVRSGDGLRGKALALHGRLWRRDVAILILMLYQGLRVGEVPALRLGDVGLQDRTLRVAGKGGRERLIPLHPRTAEAITDYLQHWDGRRGPVRYEDPLFWTLDGKPMSREAVRRAVTRHLRRAGIPGATPHALRHTFGTRLARREVDTLLIARLMGHARLDTTRIYVHLDQGQLERALSKLE